MSTIYDVARLAEVSPKTVSRVLNADGPVGDKTRGSRGKGHARAWLCAVERGTDDAGAKSPVSSG